MVPSLKVSPLMATSVCTRPNVRLKSATPSESLTSASTTAASLYLTGPFYNYVGQIRVNGVGRGLPPNNEIQIDVQLPFNMVYPSLGADIDGSVSGAVFELTDNSLLAIVNCRMVRLNANTLRIYVYFDRDIDVVVNTRELIVGYNITVNGPQL